MLLDGVQKTPWVADWGGSVAGIEVVEVVEGDVVDGDVVDGDEEVEEGVGATVVVVLELELEQLARAIDPAATTTATTIDLSAR